MRGGNMGRGRGRGRGGTSAGGPLRTDHLKMKNLYRELDLLRRRREVVQREKDLLSMESHFDRKRQYYHDRPRDMPESYGNVWQTSPPNRFDPPQTKPWQDMELNFPMSSMSNTIGPSTMDPNYIPPLFSKKVEMPRRMLPFNQGMTPLTKPVIHPMLKKTITVRKDFNPPKVLKNRPFLPNKMNSYPVEQRKNLISNATGTEERPQAEPLPVLREDQIPTQKMTGRLELALGMLVKELRYRNAHNTDFKTLIATSGPLRLVKQAIRERIRSVMLNKPVGSPADIIQIYRLRFNKERDRELVEIVLNTKNSKPLNLVESGNSNAISTASKSSVSSGLAAIDDINDPEEFFKTNINSIIEKKLEEMFSNLLKMYTDARRKAKLSYTQAAKDAIMIDKPLERETEFDEKARADKAQKIIRTLMGKQITVEERDALNQYYSDLIANILEDKITQLLPNYIKYCAKIFDMDQEYRTVKFMTVKRVRDANKVSKVALRATKNAAGQEIADEQSQEQAMNENEIDNELSNTNEEEDNEVDNEMTESYESQEVNENDNEQTQQSQEDEMNEIDNANTNAKELQEEEMNETDELSNTQESQDKENKMDSETTDKAPLQEKATIENKPIEANTVKKSDEGSVDKKQNTPATPMPAKIAESPAVRKTPVTPSKDLPYYVKLIGRPHLPTRAVICDFLNKYRPKTIKKHKSINNLLVVGFINREDYDKILEANETIIGDITIIIKASEPVNPVTNDAQKPEENAQKEEVKDEVPPSGNGLDEQTTELPSTIKEADNVVTEEAPTSGKADENISPSTESADTEGPKDNMEVKETRQFEPIMEVDEDGDSQGSEKAEKGPKGAKESGRATPVRASSRLANVTPSTIRTRRASRLLQEQ